MCFYIFRLLYKEKMIMKRRIAPVLLLTALLLFAGCSQDLKKFDIDINDIQKVVLISVDGERTDISDEGVIAQITNNIASIQFKKEGSAEKTNGFGPIVQWYDREGELVEVVSVMGEQTVIYENYFWEAVDGTIDTALYDELLNS